MKNIFRVLIVAGVGFSLFQGFAHAGLDALKKPTVTPAPGMVTPPPSMPSGPMSQMPALAEKCKKGDKAACEQLRAFGMGYSNYAKEQDQKGRDALKKLCAEGKKEACDLLKKLESSDKKNK